ncbi:hypothetical protein, partial [Streptomyces sp. NPDC004976]
MLLEAPRQQVLVTVHDTHRENTSKATAGRFPNRFPVSSANPVSSAAAQVLLAQVAAAHHLLA